MAMNKFQNLIAFGKTKCIAIGSLGTTVLSDNKINRFFELFMNNKLIIEKDVIDLFNNLMYYIETKEEFEYKADQIYRKLLSKKTGFTKSELIFFIQYTTFLNYKSVKYNKNGSIKPEYKDYKMPNMYIIPNMETFDAICSPTGLEFKYAGYLSKFTSKNTAGIRMILGLIGLINHELVHWKQRYEATHGLVTKSALYEIIDKCFRETPWYDYEENYAFVKNEIEAEIEGTISAFRIGEKYLPEETKETKRLLEKREDIILEQASSFQNNRADSKKYLTDEYNVHGLIVYVRKKPEILKKYPQLKLFFNLDGSFKGEEELLTSYKNVQSDSKIDIEVFDAFFTFMYGINSYQPFENLPPDLVKLRAKIIVERFEHEIKQYKNMHVLLGSGKHSRISRDEILRNSTGILGKRVERLHKLFDLIRDDLKVNKLITEDEYYELFTNYTEAQFLYDAELEQVQIKRKERQL